MKPDVEHRLSALEALVADPQALRNLLERTADPRGGEPRVIDADGNTLDFQGAIQFLNATSVVDGQAQRVVVTPTGGGGGGSMEAFFSDDATPTDAERAKFKDHGTPTVNHAVIDTSTTGTTRTLSVLVSEDTASPTSFGALALSADDTIDVGLAALAATADVLAQAAATATSGTQTGQASATMTGSSATAVLDASSTGAKAATTVASAQTTGAAAATVTARAAVDTGTATSRLSAEGAGGDAKVLAVSDGAGQRATVDVGPTATVLDDASLSNFLQVDTNAASPGTPLRQVMRGPFVASLTPLGAASTVTFPWPNVWSASASDASKAIIGGMQGAAGVEKVLWSWAINVDPTEPDLTFTNTSLGTLLPTFVFFGICDA